MLSINMRIFKTVLLIAFFGPNVQCLPLTSELAESKIDSKIESKTEASSILPSTTAISATSLQPNIDYYDQRQNGTENYRIHVDGVVLVFAPVEALLLAGTAGAGGSESNLSTTEQNGFMHLNTDSNKPNAGTRNKTDLLTSKTIHRPIQLANFLAPFLRRMRHEPGTIS